MEPTVAAVLGVVAGLGVALLAIAAIWLSDRGQDEDDPGTSRRIPDGVADVLAVLRSSGIVLDSDGTVVNNSPPAVAYGLVRRGQLVPEELRDLARRTREDFEVAFLCQLHITDDRRAVLDAYKPFTALYAGGMGAEEKNFHAEAFRRMGFADEVEEITRLFRAGRKDEAAAAVPDVEGSVLVLNGDSPLLTTGTLEIARPLFKRHPAWWIAAAVCRFTPVLRIAMARFSLAFRQISWTCW